eukprot:Gb_31237 [translate_table: standard]
MAARLSVCLRGSLLSSSTNANTTHAAFPQFQQSSAKPLNWSVERKDGARWVRHRMVILAGKRKQQTVARAQAAQGVNHPQDYIPEANFYKVEAIVRPWRVSHVASGLLKMGIRGVTVSDVRGFGAQGGSSERQAGSG